MDIYNHDNGSYELEVPISSGRSVIPRRLPPVPYLRTPSPSPSSIFSLSPSSSGSSSPALSSGSTSPGYSPTTTLASLKRASRPLPQIPVARHVPNQSQGKVKTQLIVCRNCMNSVTTSEGLLPASAVPPGSRAFRGFSGKASLFMEVHNVTHSQPRMQLMTTGAHTMQETFCGDCSACLGWKIIKAHERSERWKEGHWLLELENLWLARSSDILDRDSPSPAEYPKDALNVVNEAREKGLGLGFGKGYNDRHRYFSKSHGSRVGSHHGSVSAIHLPMTVAT